MFKIWSEWDIGHEGLVFKTEAAAMKWLVENQSLEECYEPGLEGQEAVDDLISAGLLTIEELNVIE